MSREKQIEKQAIEGMANDIEKSHWKIVQDFMGCHINSEEMAESLYNAGYRKQIEGEWVQKGNCFMTYACSVCGSSVDYAYQKTSFCPNCGAKMKGGAE